MKSSFNNPSPYFSVVNWMKLKEIPRNFLLEWKFNLCIKLLLFISSLLMAKHKWKRFIDSLIAWTSQIWASFSVFLAFPHFSCFHNFPRSIKIGNLAILWYLTWFYLADLLKRKMKVAYGICAKWMWKTW